jgi:hypothetical protein
VRQLLVEDVEPDAHPETDGDGPGDAHPDASHGLRRRALTQEGGDDPDDQLGFDTLTKAHDERR